jgi:hypothetical protein
MKRSSSLGACIGAVALAACGTQSSEPLKNTVDTTRSTPAPMPAPSGLAAYHLSGTVTGGDGTPLEGGLVYFTYLQSTSPGSIYQHSSTASGSGGLYSLEISALPQSMGGPRGTQDAWAFANVLRAGYEADHRYVSASTQNFRLYPVRQIAAGDSAVVTVAPDDAICSNDLQDLHPWPDEWVCRTIHVSVPADGKMIVTAAPTQLGGAVPGLVIEGASELPDYTWDAGTLTVPAVAGNVVTVHVEIPWGSDSSRSFMLHTSLIKD